MVESRSFARFRADATGGMSGYWPLPGDGLCLSVFLVITETPGSSKVLLGRPDPKADWERIGALNEARVATLVDRWMLPASQLQLFESPQDGARRILKEQLDGAEISLRGPRVFSETYRRESSPSSDPHWDFHFVFLGEWPKNSAVRATPWREIRFLDARSTDGRVIGRGHSDIVGLVLGPGA